MKSMLFKILGVVAVIAMLSAALVVAPVSALSATSLTEGSTVISTATTYTIIFNIGTALVGGSTITVGFPTGTTFATTLTGDATILTSGGFGGTGLTGTAGVVTPVVSNTTNLVLTIPGASTTTVIGSGAAVQVQFTSSCIINPGTIGTYSVTVATSAETTAIVVGSFTTTLPPTPVLPGVASVWNSAGIEISASNSLETALGTIANFTGGTIQLTSGTYTDSTGWQTNTTSPLNVPAGLGASFTILGMGTSTAPVIIEEPGSWALTGTTITVKNVTINETNGLLTVGGTGSAATVTGCAFTGGVLTMAATGTGSSNTVSNDTFTVASGLNGLMFAVPTTVSGCTFNYASTTGTGIMADAALTASGDTFTGTSTATGVGISLTNPTASTTVTSTIGTSTFTGLTTALMIANGGTTAIANATFSGNTVTNCGVTSGSAAIVVASTGGFTMTSNTVKGSLAAIISVAANDNMVTVELNSFSGNTVAATDAGNATSAALNCTYNYWGGSANNPASVTTAPLISYASPLGAAPGMSSYVTGAPVTSLASATTAGVNISNASGATELGAVNFAANPVGVTLPSTVTVLGYFEVTGNATAGPTIDLYGTTKSPVVSNTGIYFYNSAFGAWDQITSATVNTYAGYAETIVGSTNDSPTLTEFNGGLLLALVNIPVVLPPVSQGITPLYPTNGATGVPTSGVTFTWPAVTSTAGTVTYQFAIAQASANTSASEFAILDYSDNTSTNAEPSQETFQYSTVYWWEVRAITMNASGGVAATGPWSVQMFTTMPMPATTTSTAPAITVTVPVNTITVTQPITTVQSTVTSVVITQTTGTSSAAIPSYLLWVVIVVGAILVIAVIILIVRTRRIP